MKTSEKTSKSRGYVSPSYSSDIQQPSMGGLWSASTAFMVGKWAWKRFPKASVVGLLAIGAYVGYRMIKHESSPMDKMRDKMKLH